MTVGRSDAGSSTPREIMSSFAPSAVSSYRTLRHKTKAPPVAEVEGELDFYTAPTLLYRARTRRTRTGIRASRGWRKVVFRSPEMYNREIAVVAKR